MKEFIIEIIKNEDYISDQIDFLNSELKEEYPVADKEDLKEAISFFENIPDELKVTYYEDYYNFIYALEEYCEDYYIKPNHISIGVDTY